jgi:polyisoprenyl-phosphate glycosyltransferase
MLPPSPLDCLTIAAPCYNEEAVIPEFLKAVQRVADLLEAGGRPVRFLLVDDGSSDHTLQILNHTAAIDPRLRVISFSRNFGHQAALAAAIDLADTDLLILMDSDLQHPPELIPQMVAAWESGSDIVSMVRKETVSGPLVKRLTSRLFYHLFNRLSETSAPAGAADFVLLSKAPLAAVRELREYHLFWRGVISWIGFRRTFIPYTAPQRAAGVSKYSLSKMLMLAFDGLTSFSAKPMRMVMGFGLLTCGAALIYLVYIAVAAIILKTTVPGWSSLIGTVILFGGIRMVTIGIIGTYVAKTFEQVKGRPKYILADPSRARSGGRTAANG